MAGGDSRRNGSRRADEIHRSGGSHLLTEGPRPDSRGGTNCWCGVFCYPVGMSLEIVRQRLAANRDVLSQYGVAELRVFGSVAQGRDTPESDIDLLVDFSRAVGLIEFVGLQQRLGQILGRRVDLVTRAALKPQLQARILREAVRAA